MLCCPLRLVSCSTPSGSWRAIQAQDRVAATCRGDSHVAARGRGRPALAAISRGRLVPVQKNPGPRGRGAGAMVACVSVSPGRRLIREGKPGWSQAGLLASGLRGPCTRASTSRRTFPSRGDSGSRGGRHRSQRRVRGRFARPSLFSPVRGACNDRDYSLTLAHVKRRGRRLWE